MKSLALILLFPALCFGRTVTISGDFVITESASPTPSVAPTPTTTPSFIGLANAVAEWTVLHPGAPFVEYVGDSDMEGRPNFVGRRSWSGPTGDYQCDIATRVYEVSGNIVTGINDGRSGEQVAAIVTIATTYAIPSHPKYLIMNGGGNDMRWQGTTFASRQSSYDSLKSACEANGVTLVVEEVWPIQVTTNAYILAWNAGLSAWAATNGVTLSRTHDWMGDSAALPPYSTMPAALTTDGTHPTAVGVLRHAQALYSTLLHLEGQ